ncbi:unnamed protein product [Tuber melanosporum]|uniref:(Perigord truffle) hypothetical protein n=1 Tax=Tuber melanosporum (strain Mel28) TaxID=656061 RepID=D5G6A7_TUBMM|nr:uncharacterized protein GSTUM_00001679001 [Tuber melanosporum]CAZ80050.1 unnamed protein product [Tuber melanosporum]
MTNKLMIYPRGEERIFFRSIIQLSLSYHTIEDRGKHQHALIFLSTARVRVMVDSLTNRREGLAVEKLDSPAPPAPFFLLQESHPSSSLSRLSCCLLSLQPALLFSPSPLPFSFSLSLFPAFFASPKQKLHPLRSSASTSNFHTKGSLIVAFSSLSHTNL